MKEIAEYLRLADAWGTAAKRSDPTTANSLYDRIQEVFKEIRQAKEQEALFGRADHVSEAACLFIASHLKEANPRRALDLYRRLSRSRDAFIAISAQEILKNMNKKMVPRLPP